MASLELVLERIEEAAFNPLLHPRLVRGRVGGGEFAGKGGLVKRERDAVGEFTRPRGGFQSRLDKHIVDYEGRIAPGRPLGQRRQIEAIGRFLHGAQHVGYSETPFFRKLEALQGTPSPGRIKATEHEAARNALFARQPLRQIPIDPKRLVFTQPDVNRPAVLYHETHAQSQGHPAFVVSYGGKFYVMDGHHRLLAAAADHQTSYPARVLTIA